MRTRLTTVNGFHGFHVELRTEVTKEQVHAEIVPTRRHVYPAVILSTYGRRASPPCLLSLPHAPHYPVLLSVLLKLYMSINNPTPSVHPLTTTHRRLHPIWALLNPFGKHLPPVYAMPLEVRLMDALGRLILWGLLYVKSGMRSFPDPISAY